MADINFDVAIPAIRDVAKLESQLESTQRELAKAQDKLKALNLSKRDLEVMKGVLEAEDTVALFAEPAPTPAPTRRRRSSGGTAIIDDNEIVAFVAKNQQSRRAAIASGIGVEAGKLTPKLKALVDAARW